MSKHPEGMSVNKIAGGYAFGALLDAPFSILEVLMELGPISKGNFARNGMQSGSDTMAFWWDQKSSGILTDSPMWVFNLIAEYVLTRFPTRTTSPLYKIAELGAKNRAFYVGVRVIYTLTHTWCGYALVYPDDRASVLLRNLISMPSELNFKGVN